MARMPMNILLCTCEHFHAVPEETVSAVRAALDQTGAAVEEVDDLCGLAARHDERLAPLARSAQPVVIACYPRAVRWLFAAAGAPLDDGRCALLNMHEQGADEIARRLSALGAPARPEGGDGPAREAAPAPVIEADWPPWFPVLDYDRCINCKQCMSFCLFGVFEIEGDGRVVVRNPHHCKVYCPACARICPEAAIMFPKLDQAPFNGAEPDPNAHAATQVNLTEALGQDLYATLRSRGKGQRFAPADARARAQAERDRCATIQAVQEKLGIPSGVIESLCGPACACNNQAPADGPACACNDQAPADGPACACNNQAPAENPDGCGCHASEADSGTGEAGCGCCGRQEE